MHGLSTIKRLNPDRDPKTGKPVKSVDVTKAGKPGFKNIGGISLSGRSR